MDGEGDGSCLQNYGHFGEITSGSIHEPSPAQCGAAGRGKNLAVSPELLLAAALVLGGCV